MADDALWDVDGVGFRCAGWGAVDSGFAVEQTAVAAGFWWDAEVEQLADVASRFSRWTVGGEFECGVWDV
jgi:hypothetical protein